MLHDFHQPVSNSYYLAWRQQCPRSKPWITSNIIDLRFEVTSFTFPLTPVAHLVPPPHTGGNVYGRLLPWQREAVPWVFYYLLGVNSALHQALVPECVPCQSVLFTPCATGKCISVKFMFCYCQGSRRAHARLCEDTWDKCYLSIWIWMRGNMPGLPLQL